MKLYDQTSEVIYNTQNKDPFFWYLTYKLFSYVNTHKSGVVLDLGCGSGRNTFYAARLGFKAIGVDAMQKAVYNGNSHAKSEGVYKRVKFVKADISKLKPLQFGRVDYVILNEVIEHIKNYQKVIDFAYASLKPGGKILLTTPNDPAQWTILDDYAQHVKRFTLPEIKESLQAFSDIHLTTVGFPLHRLFVTLYDWYQTKKGHSHEPKAFRRTPFVSGLYYLIGRIVMSIDNMLNTPWGTTILAIGTK